MKAPVALVAASLTAATIVLTASLLLAGARSDASFGSWASPLEVHTVASGLANPWASEFLPDGRLLVTQRPGRMRIVTDGQLSPPLKGVPEVWALGQGGMLDVILDRTFAQNNRSISVLPNAPTAVAAPPSRAPPSTPAPAGSTRSGSSSGRRPVVVGQSLRLPDRTGQRRQPVRRARRALQRAQRSAEPRQPSGKIIRIAPDGAALNDNPFVGRDGAKPESGATAIATSRAWRSIRAPATFGRSSTVRAAAMRSTSSAGRTTAGR